MNEFQQIDLADAPAEIAQAAPLFVDLLNRLVHENDGNIDSRVLEQYLTLALATIMTPPVLMLEALPPEVREHAASQFLANSGEIIMAYGERIAGE